MRGILHSLMRGTSLTSLGYRGGAGGGGVAPVLAIRPVAGRTAQTYVNTHGSDGVNTEGKYLANHPVFVGGCAGQLAAAFANRCSEGAGFNAITVGGWYRYPAGVGLWSQWLFGGLPSKVIAATDPDVWTDDAAVTMVAGGRLETISYVRVASAGMKWPTLDYISLSAANGEGALLATTDISGSTVTPSDVDEFYGPVAIRGLSSAPIAYGLHTDSIGNGAGDTKTFDHRGHVQRAIAPLAPYLPCGTSGALVADSVAAFSKTLATMKAAGVNAIAYAKGTNDISNGASYATLRADTLSELARYAAEGWPITYCSILTQTTGNITTPRTGFTVGGICDQINALFASLPGIISYFWDVRAGYQNGSNQVLNGAYTVDFTHPTNAGFTAILAAAPAFSTVFAPLSPIVPPVPSFWSTGVWINPETLRGVVANGAAITTMQDTRGVVTATATNVTFKATATPNGKAAIDFPAGGLGKMVIPAGAQVDNIFATTGTLIYAFKMDGLGGDAGASGRLWTKGTGSEVIGFNSANLRSTFDRATTDPTIETACALGVWHVRSDRFAGGGGRTAMDVLPYTNMSASSGANVDNSGGALIIGNHPTLARGMDGELAGMIWFKDDTLTADQQPISIAYMRAITGCVII